MANKKFRNYWKKAQPKKVDNTPELKPEYERCEVCGVPFHKEGRDKILWCKAGSNCGMAFSPPTNIYRYCEETGTPIEDLIV